MFTPLRMDGSFNGQILVDKLAKLTNTQQSIETLSHWCIFHRSKAKQVVETWDRLFHSAPKEQRICFLYLANDILQNSRRKGLEFINEFWKVLPDALSDAYYNGDNVGRSTALRLVDIWEERKVFGSRGQVLKEEMLARRGNRNRTGISTAFKLKQHSRELIEKFIASYEDVDNITMDEEALMEKTRVAAGFLNNVKTQIEAGDKSDISQFKEQIKNQQSVLRDSLEGLQAIISARATLKSQLREAIHEQEMRMEQLDHHHKIVLPLYQQANELAQQFNIEAPTEQIREESSSPALSNGPSGFQSVTSSIDKVLMPPVRYTQEGPLINNESNHSKEESQKRVAAGRLTVATTSPQMLSYVLSSLASDGIIGQSNKAYHPDNKRPRIENNEPTQLSSPQMPLQPPLPLFPRPDVLQLPPLPPISLPLIPPPPFLPSLTQFMPSATEALSGIPYGYGSSPPTFPLNFPMLGMPYPGGTMNPYQNFQVSEGLNYVSHPPLPASAPLPPPPPPSQQ